MRARSGTVRRLSALRFLSVLVFLSALVAACSETRRSLGEECLKNHDCVSGICSQLQCAPAPLLLEGSIGPAEDATVLPGDAAIDADGGADAVAPPLDAASSG